MLTATLTLEETPADIEIKANKQLLKDLSKKIGTLTTAQYTWQYENSVSSIGKHIRHIIDHYSCFFKTLAENYINYDNRPRVPVLETRVDAATRELDEIGRRLSELRNFKPGRIYILISVDPDEKVTTVESNLKRELLFLQSHTLHHMAVIQLMLRLLGSQVDSDFAYAPSTKKFLKKSGGGYE